jgi:hypothetical protein
VSIWVATEYRLDTDSSAASSHRRVGPYATSDREVPEVFTLGDHGPNVGGTA